MLLSYVTRGYYDKIDVPVNVGGAKIALGHTGTHNLWLKRGHIAGFEIPYTPTRILIEDRKSPELNVQLNHQGYENICAISNAVSNRDPEKTTPVFNYERTLNGNGLCVTLPRLLVKCDSSTTFYTAQGKTLLEPFDWRKLDGKIFLSEMTIKSTLKLQDDDTFRVDWFAVNVVVLRSWADSTVDPPPTPPDAPDSVFDTDREGDDMQPEFYDDEAEYLLCNESLEI